MLRLGRRLHVAGLHAHVGGGHGGWTRLDCPGPDDLCHLAAGACVDRGLFIWWNHHSYLSYASPRRADSLTIIIHAAVSRDDSGAGSDFTKRKLDQAEYACFTRQKL